MSEVTTRADVERLCWSLSGWRVEQRDVDRLLAAMDAYASGRPFASGGVSAQSATPVEAVFTVPRENPVSASESAAPPQVTVEPSGPRCVPEGAAGGREGIEGAYVLTVTRVQRPDKVKKVLPTPQADRTEPERTCRKCGVTYPIEKFNRDYHSRGGRKTACKPCENIRRRDARRVKRANERAARGEG